MDIETYRNYCLAKTDVTEGFPFDNKILVFKVGGKIFALTDVDDFEFINLKCDPERSMELRERHLSIKPGYHMNKKWWNSVYPNGDVDDILLRKLIDESYQLIRSSLPKKVQKALEEMEANE